MNFSKVSDLLQINPTFSRCYENVYITISWPVSHIDITK